MVYAFLVHTVVGGPSRLLYSAVYGQEPVRENGHSTVTDTALSGGGGRGGVYGKPNDQ